MLTWRVGDARAAARSLAPAAFLAIATLAIALWASGGRAWPAIGLALGVWLIAGGFIYLWTRWGRGGGHGLAKFIALPLAVWSMSLAHLGAGFLTLGAVTESAFRQERSIEMQVGETVEFAGRRVTLMEFGGAEGPNYFATRADLLVQQGAHTRAIAAERRYFPTAPAPTSEVAIASALDGDLYIALSDNGRDSAGARTLLRFYFNPLVHLIFWGVGMMGLGGALSLLSQQRKRKPAP
jgi:cytochrome c-type biogenesis protein CcmF